MISLLIPEPLRSGAPKHIFRLTFGVATLLMASVSATILPPERVVPWVPGVTVGPQTVFPVRTNLIDVTKPPYNADNTGATDASIAIQAAINAAHSNDVVYLPTGRYIVTNSMSIDTSYITLRGDGPTNSVLIGIGDANSQNKVFRVGHDAYWLVEGDTTRDHTIIGGATKGSTSLVMNSVVNSAGRSVQPGDGMKLSTSTRNIGTDNFPVIAVDNSDRIINQVVMVKSVSGTTVNITAPLVWDFTNNPILTEQNPYGGKQPTIGLGLENFGITLTNSLTGAKGSGAVYLIYSGCLRDSWFSNLDMSYALNYQFYIYSSANCAIRNCSIHDGLFSGPNHSGLNMEYDSGFLIENNIFANGVFPGIEFNGGVMGCAFFANYFTNNILDVDCHNTHPMMNLFEQNVFSCVFKMDGYFGSASHQTLLRNVSITNGIAINRFASCMNVVGNVIGNTFSRFAYEWEQVGYGGPNAVFKMGFPNIGNYDYAGVNPPIAWNFPGTSLVDNNGLTHANGIYTFTNTQGPTNVLWGNFTNVPAQFANMYPLVFQDPVNTNLYYGKYGFGSMGALAPGTSSNLTLNSTVTVSNGWRLFIAGQNAYQQLQSATKATHILHGNLVYTNGTPSVVWDPAIPDHTVPVSLLYTNGAPSWWGGGQWPAIGPDQPAPTAPIPAQTRFRNQFSVFRPAVPTGFHVAGFLFH